MKDTKFSVAIFLINPENDKEFLIVKRPEDDDKLPNVWGLPAVTIKGNELPEDAVRRVGKEKLNTEIEPVGFMGIKRVDRGDYDFILMDIKSKLVGRAPSVFKAKTVNTKYIDQKWTMDLNLLKEAASKGSLCSQIILDVNFIEY
ncbi:MAG: NUDIX hydrolase [Candidatus Shapirobacteria bacterium]|nr:NUDIX hydrolase [Candidatus Shapirobacteria bacterium]MDD4382608.1 NUDIX hydrolase [Candidatus Shapirobacteria bacterium]